MSYKRPVHSYKKYASPFYSPNPPYSMNSSSTEPDAEFAGIPLPNEKETSAKETSAQNHNTPPRFAPFLSGMVNYIRHHVKIEDIILIGLIILILDESIDDDLLLIILIYILLF